VRPSGTEPLVRVMVEAPEQALADEVAAGIAHVVREECRAKSLTSGPRCSEKGENETTLYKN
jgi:hypothetical protein